MAWRKRGSNIPYPWGKCRTNLGSLGLIGKIHLTSMMSEEDVRNEVRSVFRGPMAGKQNFPFTFLQPTGYGSKCLTIPAVSQSFEWTAQQVAKLGGNKGVVYIVADGKLDVQELEVYCNCNLVLGSIGTEFCLLLVNLVLYVVFMT